MKKFFIIFYVFLLVSSNFVFADDDMWDNYMDPNVYGQKAVSQEEFDKALEQKTKHKKNKNIPKGAEFYQSNETEMLKIEMEELPVLCVPVNLHISQEYVLPVGHYQVMGEMRDGKPYLKLYQAHTLIAEFPANLTKNDYGAQEVNFVKLIENGEEQVVIIFGSLDFNAYTSVNIAK